MKHSNKRSATAVQSRVIQTSRHWQVTHHRHTGHLLPRHTTSYPTLLMIVLCLGVFLVSWTRFVTADPITNSYVVNASVPGPPPTVAAVIETPAEGTIFTDLPINVGGTCPLNTYVNLYRNAVYSGTALCQPTGRFALDSGLFVGVNKLEARVFSLTDLPGPLSDPVSVIYQPPVLPTTESPAATPSNENLSPSAINQNKSTNKGNNLPPPLLLKTTFKYQGQYTGQATTWQLELVGGTAPYAISIDWGDGTKELISRQRAGLFNPSHTYKKHGGYKGSYVIKFSATDVNGHETFLQVLTIVNDPPAGVAATGSKPPSYISNGGPSYHENLVKYIWPGYVIVLLMLASFWLGERREYKYLKPYLKKVRRA